MPAKDASLNDIAQSIQDLGSLDSQEISAPKQDLTGRMDMGFAEIKGDIEALGSDIRDLYEMLSNVQEDVKKLRKTDKQLNQRLTDLEEFAERLSKQTGVSFRG